jgi:hypothetical protein
MLITTALLLGTVGCCPNLSAPRTPKVHLWFTSSAGQGDLPTAAKWFNLVWESSEVINLGSILVGNATLVVANVLTCNNHSQNLWGFQDCPVLMGGTCLCLWCEGVVKLRLGSYQDFRGCWLSAQHATNTAGICALRR